MAKSKIEWTDAVWNPVTGCTKISPGCDHCYAERMAKRLAGRCGYDRDKPFGVTIHMDRLNEPFHWRKPRRVFVCSMGDLFHGDVQNSFIDDVFIPIYELNNCLWMILTKRPGRMKHFINHTPPLGKNFWLGISIESADQTYRLVDLQQTVCPHRFISFEPLLGPIGKINLSGIEWVIVGGESGPGARPMKPEWVREIRDVCIEQSVKFFFKQWGGVNKKKAGRILDGRTWDEMPDKEE
jgi:protein gp37